MENHYDHPLSGKHSLTKKDVSGFQLIGDGKDGEVYLLNPDQCVKIFFLKETKDKEYEAFKIGQASPVFPRLYAHGENYIVMEFIKGISLSHYLKKERAISVELTRKILNMLNDFKELGFTRWDAEARHIFINEEGHIKVIDHKRAFTSNNKVPEKLLKGIKKYKLFNEFLANVQQVNPALFREWTK